jgi:uncharacterized membrane protein
MHALGMKTFNGWFIKGLITVLPISLTLYLLFWMTARIDSIFGTPFTNFIGEHYIPGMGLLVGFVVILLVGASVNNYVSKHFFEWLEKRIQGVPFVKTIYNPLRDVMNLFGSQTSQKMKRVVLIEIVPGSNIKSLGLVTRDRFLDLPESQFTDLIAVFVPYSYALGGFTFLVPKSQIQEVDISVEKAMQLAITAWVPRQ